MTTAFDHARQRALQSLLSAAASADTPDARLFGALVAARAQRNELGLLGLSHPQLAGLLTRQFPHLPAADVAALAPTAVMAVLPSTHAAFVTTLHTRLMDDANPAADRDDAACLASIIAHACLRPDHLWRDLGLDGRDAVSAMLDRYFPALAARNVAPCAGRNSSHRKWPPRLTCRRAPPPGARAARISASAFLTHDNHRGDRAAHSTREAWDGTVGALIDPAGSLIRLIQTEDQARTAAAVALRRRWKQMRTRCDARPINGYLVNRIACCS